MKVKVFISIVLGAACSYNLIGQFNYEWGFTMGASFTDAVYDIAIDKENSIYITGYMSAPLDFEPGQAIVYPENLEPSNIFFAKYRSSGELVFVKSIGDNNSSGDFTTNINVDNDKNIYISGLITSDTDFDPGPESALVLSDGDDGFMAKYDSLGNFLNAFSIDSYSSGLSSRLSPKDELIIFGWLLNISDFDPGPDELLLDGGGWGAINYLVKYDSVGEPKFGFTFDTIATFSSNPSMVIYDAVGDDAGCTFITGYISGIVDFQPGPEVFLLSSGQQESPFLAKYDPSGNLLSAFILESSEGNIVYNSSIDIDNFNNIYLTITFNGVIDANPGSGILEINSQQTENTLFAKYDSFGTLIFAKQIKSMDGENGLYSSLVYENNIYLNGTFSGIIDLDPGETVASFTDDIASNIYLSKYDENGNYLDAMVFGGIDFETPYGMMLDHQQNIYIVGEFNTDINFDLETGDFQLSNGYQDIFIAKYSQAPVRAVQPADDERIVSASPNPGPGLFRIPIPEGILPVHPVITDISGRLVAPAISVQGTEWFIDLRSWPAGVYVASIRSGEEAYSLKLVKI